MNHLFYKVAIISVILLLGALVLVLRELVKDMAGKASSRIAELWPICFRGMLYFSAAFLTAIIDKIGGILFNDTWPSVPRTVGAMLVGTLGGIIAVRAYNDGSAQRLGDEINAKKQKDYDTEQFRKLNGSQPPLLQQKPPEFKTTFTPNPFEPTKQEAPASEPTKGNEMKQTTVSDTLKGIPGVVLGLLLLAAPAFGQTPATNTPTPTVTSALSDLFSAISYDKTNWVYEVHGMYAPALQGKYGGGLGAFYPISRYVFTGVRLDYVDGGFYMPSGSAGLQLPITPVSWLTIKPFAYAGIGIPLAGATVGNYTLPGHPVLRDNNGQATAILGIGAAVSLYTSKSGKYSLELVGDRENWSGFAGQQYRAGLLVHVLF